MNFRMLQKAIQSLGAGGCRKSYYDKLHNLYSSPNIVTVIESRRTKCTAHVESMRRMRNAYRILVGKREGKIPLGRLGVFRRIIKN